MVPVRNPGGQLLSLRLDGARLIAIVVGALSQSRLIPLLPLTLDHTLQSNDAVWRGLTRQSPWSLPHHLAAW